MPNITKIVPCLWFDDQAEAAAGLYTSIFPDSRIVATTHFGKEGFEIHGRPEGSVMSVDFELQGQRFTALNGGPMFHFTEAISFQVECADQEEIDHYWERLSDGGDPAAQQCGWLKDRFGLSWQIVPRILPELLDESDPARVQRVMRALLEMQKLDLGALQRAFAG